MHTSVTMFTLVVGMLLLAEGVVLRRPVAFLHIPKTGTSFLNAVMSLACDAGWPHTLGRELEHLFWSRNSMNRGCAGGFTSSKSTPQKLAAFRATVGDAFLAPRDNGWYRSPPGHAGFGPWAEANAPLAVTLLRQPEQRLLSGFYAGKHGWHGERNRNPTPRVYAEKLQGCQVRYLTRGGEQCNSRQPPPTPAEVQRAILTLKRLQFVGLSDEWDLTICLWHRMFGGAHTEGHGAAPPWWARCNATHFRNTRPTGLPLAVSQTATMHAATTRDVSLLGGFRDEADRRLYAIARLLFKRRLVEFNVTAASCAPCFNAHAGAHEPSRR